jgi:outer membrane protein assembly factor BamB
MNAAVRLPDGSRSVPTSPRPWIVSCLALIVLTGSAMVAAQIPEWSRFRGPNGTGIVSDAGYPIEFGPSRNLKWRAAVRPGKSSPVLSRRHVFLTAFEGGRLYTQCFERASGRLMWERSDTSARPEGARPSSEPSAATPVTDGDNVYVFFEDIGVISYDAAGAVRWKMPMGPFANRMGAVASPIIAGASLVLVLDQMEHSEIVALSLATGAVQWRCRGRRSRRGRHQPSTRRPASRRRSSPRAAVSSAGTPSRVGRGCGRRLAWRRRWWRARSSRAIP